MVDETQALPPEEQKYKCDPGNFLDMLGEEASEISKERYKMIRFGHHPGGRAPGYEGTPAREMFHQEIGDFLAVLEHAIENGDVDKALLNQCKRAKHNRLHKLFGLLPPANTSIVIADLSK